MATSGNAVFVLTAIPLPLWEGLISSQRGLFVGCFLVIHCITVGTKVHTVTLPKHPWPARRVYGCVVLSSTR
jgi:hypothetical protein